MALPSREWKKSEATCGCFAGLRIIVGIPLETQNDSRDGIAIRGVPFHPNHPQGKKNFSKSLRK